MRETTIPTVDAASADLAALGHVIGIPAGVAPRTSDFYGDAVRLWKVDGFASDADTTLTVARLTPRPPEVRFLERHFKHTQAFIPLGNKPYVVVMAPPTPDGLPAPADVKAYRFPGNTGFLMHVGTWHEFPFALEPDTDVIVVLRHETNRNLQQIEHGEARGADLEKRNLQMRFGTTLRFGHTAP